MTEAQARTTANVVMAAAAFGAAVIVLRSPTLRRLVWQITKQYATGPLAVYAATAVRDAWSEAGTARIAP
jgi:predicted SpoU family rRNA methylase